MRLLALHADTVNALERLHIPFDDLTPQGLWGTPYHLIGVTAEQRDVLRAWNIEVEDRTPQSLSRKAVAATLRDAVTETNRPRMAPPRPVAARPAAPAPEPAAEPVLETAIPTIIAVEPVEMPSASNVAAEPDDVPTDSVGPMRLRINVGGRYKEASVEDGQINVDGRTFDSPASATKGIAAGKAEWSFWEYFDEGAGKWRMLDRNWQPT